MSYLNEDEAQRIAGFGASVTQAVGSNAAVDIRDEFIKKNVITEDSVNPQTVDDAQALKFEHPDYVAEAPKWQKYLNLYNSKDVYRYIFRHLRETDVKWKQRVERGYFFNYVKSVVDLFTAFLFHHPVDRVPGKNLEEDFEEIYKDADRSGTSWNTYFQEVCTYAQVEGHVGILVDMPATEAEIGSEQERKERGLRPFLTLIHSIQIKDWEVDEHNNFIWVKIEVIRPQERTWKTEPSSDRKTYQIWDKETWEEWECDKDSTSGTGESARKVAEGKHGLGVVPLCIVRLEKSDHSWFGQSAVTDISDINIGIMNWSSLGDEEIYERCLNILAMEAGDDGRPIELGHGNTLEFPQGTEKPPYYLEPGATPLNSIQAWVDNAKNEIRRLAKINLSAGLGDVRQSSSGIAKAFSFIETNQSLAAKALNMEQAEIKIHKLVALYFGETFEGTVTYPKEFGVEDWLTLYQELQSAKSTLSSPTARKEAEKQFIRRLFSRFPIEMRNKMEEEVDNAETISANPSSAFGMTPFEDLTESNSVEGQVDAGLPNQAEPGSGNRNPNPGEATSAQS